MRTRCFLCCVLLVVATLPVTGCGLVLAPITGPDALPNNKSVIHRGEIVDANGVALRDVKIHVVYPRATTWGDYVFGLSYPPSKLDIASDGLYSFTLNCSESDHTRIRFEKLGYFPYEMTEWADAMAFEVPYESARSGLTIPAEKISFERHEDCHPGDVLRIVMQRNDEPRKSQAPTIIERRAPVSPNSP